MTKSKKKVDLKIVGLAILIVGSLLFVIFAALNSRSGESQISEDQIKVSRGDRTVTVNRGGKVEYKSSDGVFYEFWDDTRVNNFFSSMESAAREYLANPQPPSSGNSYEVTLWLDGEIVTIYILEDDPLLEEIFEEFDDYGGGGGGDIGDYFDDDDDEDGGGGRAIGATPTDAPLVGGNTPTPTTVAGQGGGGETVQIPPDCDLYNQFVNQRTVISNTICQTDEDE